MESETALDARPAPPFEARFSLTETEQGFPRDTQKQPPKNPQIREQFDSLKQLQDGWCHGGGLAPKKPGLETIAKILIENYPENLAAPTITPTLEGDLLLEWPQKNRPWVNLDLDSFETEYVTLDYDGKAEVETFDLSKESDIPLFMDCLQRHIEPRPPGTVTPRAKSHYLTSAERIVDLEAGRTRLWTIEEVAKEYGLEDQVWR